MNQTLLKPEEKVLSTMNRDGTRLWLKPRLSRGNFLRWRRFSGWFLIIAFVLLPHIRVGGKPFMLLDLARRRFTIFGFTFLPTDTLLLALFIVGTVLTIVLLTALFGRVWCGWACPQTVYMEFLYRPVERFFEGTAGRGGRPRAGGNAVRSLLKYAVFLALSMFLAHTFLAYFIGVDQLATWLSGSPFEHPAAFLVMFIATAMMMLDFVYFREQTCIVACPYGRLQSVMHDRHSMIISYDHRRGEPRGKKRKGEDSAALGDCVDCGLCMSTCPTGIDIRGGLQMECVGCAQCIDACNGVMDKLGRPRGLIRYSSQATVDGEKKRLLRARVVLYPLLLLVVASAFVVVFSGKGGADVTVLRGLGSPFTLMANDEVSNQVRLKVVNRTDTAAEYTMAVADDIDARLVPDENPFGVAAGETRIQGVLVIVPRTVFTGGKRDITLRVTDNSDSFSADLQYRLLGPAGAATRAPGTPSATVGTFTTSSASAATSGSLSVPAATSGKSARE